MVGAPISLSDIAVLIPPEDAALQRRAVTDLLRRDHMSFPGAQPVSFARKHLKELKTTDYFMCEKTDGIRCLLFLTEIPTEDGGMMEAQFLIDRKNDYYFVGRESLHIPGPGGLATYHTGTLLDGELVRQSFPNGKERLAYLVFDLLALAGENICPKPFDKRLARRDKFIGAPFSDFAKKYPEDVDAQPFHLVMKRMEFPYVAEMMFKEKIPNLPHGNDGLIFTCKDTPYEFGTDQHILKWKPPKENTIDFRLVLGEFPKLRDDEGEFEDWDACPDMELWVNHGGGKGYQFFAPLTLVPQEWTALKSLNQTLDGRILECYRNPVNGSWRPKLDNGSPRFRDDKSDANHISTVDSVLESIEDAVSEEDLIRIAGDVRREFKARAEEQKRREEERLRVEKMEMENQRRKREAAERQEDDDGPKYED